MDGSGGALGTVRRRLAVAVVAVAGLACATAGGTAPSPGAPAAGKAPLELRYVANAGALVGAGETKVLIDALFDKPNPEYRAPSAEVIEAMTAGTAPFDGVDVALVTHNHPDHFDAGVAARFLERQRKAVLVAPSDAVAELRKAAADWARVEKRVVSLDLAVRARESRTLGGVSVEAMRTLHSGDRESPMNLMYVLELGGWRVFHEGDSAGKVADFERFGLGGAPIDLALVHFWFPLEPNCAQFLQETLKPAHIALTHLPIRLEGDAPGKIDMVRKYYADVFLLTPGIPAKTWPVESRGR